MSYAADHSFKGDRPTFGEYARFSSVVYSHKLREYFNNPEPNAGDTPEEELYRQDVKILHDKGWRLERQQLPEPGTDGYSGAIFYHEGRGQIVSAHRGTQNFGSKKTDLFGVILGQETNQEAAAVALTAQAVEKAKALNAHLSNVGHSLGGWLAQISMFHCVRPEALGRQVHYENVSAFTFDNPGATERIEKLQSPTARLDLSQLDITSVLSWPNSVNTCGTQIPSTIYFVNPPLDDNYLIYLVYSFNNAHRLANIRRIFNEVTSPDYPNPSNCHLMYDWPVADHGDLTSFASNLGKVATGISAPAASTIIAGAKLVAVIPGFFKAIYGFIRDPKRIRGTTEGEAVRKVFENIDPRHPESIAAIANLDSGQLYSLLTTGHLYVGAASYRQSLLMKHFEPRVSAFLLMYKENTGLGDKLELATDEIECLNQYQLSTDKSECKLGETGNIFEFRRKVTDMVLSRNLDFQLAVLIESTTEKTIEHGEQIKDLVTDSQTKQAKILELEKKITAHENSMMMMEDQNSALYKGMEDEVATLKTKLDELRDEAAVVNGNIRSSVAVFAYETAVATGGKGTIAMASIGSIPAQLDLRAQKALDAAKEVALKGLSTLFIDRGAYNPDGDALVFIGHSAEEAAKAGATFKNAITVFAQETLGRSVARHAANSAIASINEVNALGK